MDNKLLLQQAIAAHTQGELKKAGSLYATILKSTPNHPDANHNLGVLYLSLDQSNEALFFLKAALELHPNYVQFWISYIDALIKGKKFEEVEEVIELGKVNGMTIDKIDILAKEIENSYVKYFDPQKPIQNDDPSKAKEQQAFSNWIQELRQKFIPPKSVLLSLLDHYQNGRLDMAEKEAIFITNKYPSAGFGWKVLGAVTRKKGKLKESLIANEMAVQLVARDEEAHSSLGNTLKDLGRLAEAELSYKKAIELKPDFAEAYSNYGTTLQDLGRLEEAEDMFKKAIALKPDYAEAYYNLGHTLQKKLHLKEAIINYKKSIEIKAEIPEAFNNLGICLHKVNRLDEAEHSYRNAINLRPNYGDAFSNLGTCLHKLGRLAESKQAQITAISLIPKNSAASSNLSVLLAYMSDYENVCKYSDDALNLALSNRDSPKAVSEIWESRLYAYIYHPDLSSEAICAEHIKWGDRFNELGKQSFLDHDRVLNRRLRVGYVSPDFRKHTCRFYFEPLFSAHDKEKFELFAYSNVINDDEHTKRFKSYFQKWRDIYGLPDEEVATIIRKDKIDILIDGCGHMDNTRLDVFAHKPAPIQVTWLGSAWTTGLRQMDYVLFDPYMAPDGIKASEEIIRLPKTWAAFRPGEIAKGCSVKETPATINEFVTFGYSGRTERLNHRVFKTWGQILKQLPNSHLILDYQSFSDPQTQIYYMDLLEKFGVETSRVKMRNSNNIFEGLADIDILLDSFPHGGGTMLFDSVWMGVPVVTLASNRPVGRIGTSLMSNLGLPDWVAQSEQDYVHKAVTFGGNIPLLKELRSSMRKRMQASPVMDEHSFAQDVENAYKNMWQTWLAKSQN